MDLEDDGQLLWPLIIDPMVLQAWQVGGENSMMRTHGPPRWMNVIEDSYIVEGTILATHRRIQNDCEAYRFWKALVQCMHADAALHNPAAGNM
eukprot:6466192-Amphidinium_carterae.1